MKRADVIRWAAVILACGAIGLAWHFLSPDEDATPAETADEPARKSMVRKRPAAGDTGGPADKAKGRSGPAAEQRVLDLVERDDLDAKLKIARLLSLAPELAGEARLLALGYAAELTPTADIEQLVPKLFELADSPEQRRVIVDDVLMRDMRVRLPVLVGMLELPWNDEERQMLRDVIATFIGDDHGPDAKDWEAPVRDWLEKNAAGSDPALPGEPDAGGGADP